MFPPLKKTNQVPTSFPPNFCFFAKQKKQIPSKTADQNGAQKHQVSCCSFFCACKLSSRSCCLGLGEDLLTGMILQAGEKKTSGPKTLRKNRSPNDSPYPTTYHDQTIHVYIYLHEWLMFMVN